MTFLFCCRGSARFCSHFPFGAVAAEAAAAPVPKAPPRSADVQVSLKDETCHRKPCPQFLKATALKPIPLCASVTALAFWSQWIFIFLWQENFMLEYTVRTSDPPHTITSALPTGNWSIFKFLWLKHFRLEFKAMILSGA